MHIILTLVAALPIILILVLMVGYRMPAVKAMPFALLVTIMLATGVWQLPSNIMGNAMLKGIFIAFSIIFIIFGAILLVRLLELGGAINRIKKMLASVSSDPRVQVVLIAWLFGAFLEGAAGFGTPQAITAPLMISLGFPPLAALLAAVLANSTPVTFGAAGVPITYGLASWASIDILGVSQNAALIHALCSFIVPLAIVFVMTRHFGGKWKDFTAAIPFALFTAFAFSLPMLAIAWTMGPELATILGAAIGLVLAIAAAKMGILVPKNKWRFPSRWDASWKGAHIPHSHKRIVGPISSLMPYALVAGLLIISRLDSLPFKAWLQSISIMIPLGADSWSWQFLYSPGAVFLVGCAVAVWIYSLRMKDLANEAESAYLRLKMPFVALMAAVATVQILLATSKNTVGLPSMPGAIAQSASLLGSKLYLMISPFIGTLGSFIAGSNTVSNLLFGPVQLESALALGIPVVLVLALQSVGGAVGNMIAVHNVIAASAAAGVSAREGDIIRTTIVPCLIYAFVAGLIGLLFYLI